MASSANCQIGTTSLPYDYCYIIGFYTKRENQADEPCVAQKQIEAPNNSFRNNWHFFPVYIQKLQRLCGVAWEILDIAESIGFHDHVRNLAYIYENKWSL